MGMVYTIYTQYSLTRSTASRYSERSCNQYIMAVEFMSVLQDLIQEAIPRQKSRMKITPILKGYEAMEKN